MKNFCENYGLGGVLALRPVSGGLLHKMYQVETTSGIYAVKVLNPEIMQRPTALQNTVNSEKVAHVLENIVPLVAAKEFNGAHVVEQDGTWFMVFDWIEGASAFAPDITVEHCAKIGEMLGKIHAADVEVEGMEPEAEVRDVFDWEKLCKAMPCGERGFVSALNDFLPELLALDADVVHALKISSSHQVISHRDLDPKNVMWQGNQPYIIDWEAAGYVNPFQELVEVINYWITEVDGSYNFEKLEALMDAYRIYKEIRFVDWDTVLLRSFDGILGWLEYNMRRAAGMTGEDIADRKEGKKQVEGTIAQIKRQRAQMEELRSWLYEHR
ncbi:MAG: phosphotransferase [Lachnospiraceae bacterium]|nr:phosphotransferase [Lachnospiraceae bacterium]